MELLLVLGALVLVDLLAVRYGTDSRPISRPTRTVPDGITGRSSRDN